MHRNIACLAVLLVGVVQAPSEEDAVVRAWFDRMNALDESDESIDALVELYAADALHITGPESHELGTVTFAGHENIRTMARDFAARYQDFRFRIQVVTAREESVTLFHRAEGPWGGAAIAVEYVAAFTRREDEQRLMFPGAAFFQLENGKIRRLRLYHATGEVAPVE